MITASVPDTLGNLGAGNRIHARCPRCDGYFDVPIPALIERLGEKCPTIEAMKRVNCGQCGKRAETWRGYGGGPVTRHIADPRKDTGSH